MNTTNGNFNELDEMKQQMQMLQDKFQKEVTINDRLIQESIRHKMSWNKNFFGRTLFLFLFSFLSNW